MSDTLTKEQAIIISGFTGVTLCPFGLLHEEVEKRLGRPVFTHEFASELFAEDVVRELFRDEFIALCYTGE